MLGIHEELQQNQSKREDIDSLHISMEAEPPISNDILVN